MSIPLHALIQYIEQWTFSLSVVGPVLGALVLASFFLSITRRSIPLPNEPPVVPYLIPWVGHTISLLKDSKRFLAEANDMYGDMYAIVILGRKYVVVSGKSLVFEMLKAGDGVIDFRAAQAEILPTRTIIKQSYSHKFIPNFEEGPIVPAIQKNLKAHQLEHFRPLLEEAIKTGIENHIGPDGAKWDHPWKKLQHVVARIACLCFAGEEIGRDEALIATMADFTYTMVVAGVIAGNLPTWLSSPILKRMYSLRSAIDVIHDRAKLTLDQRLKEQQQSGWKPPQDMLQWMHDIPLSDGGDRHTSDTAIMLGLVGLASIHTTSMFSLFALHELAARPDIVAALRIEIAKATADAGGVLTSTVTDRIPLLDSVLRETLRLNGDILGLRHLTMRDYVFRNGMVVKKGMIMIIPNHYIHTNPEIQPSDTSENLEDFDAYRFVNIPSKKSYNSSPSYIAFGGGPRVCPGRYFAVQEIKFILASILVRYNIRGPTKGRAPNQCLFGMVTFPPNVPLIFEPIETEQDQ